MAKVEIFPAGELEFANVEMIDGKIIGEPVFYGSGREQVPVAMLVVKVDDVPIHRYVLRISGTELKLSLQERSSPVRPAYEVPADELKATSKPAKG